MAFQSLRQAASSPEALAEAWRRVRESKGAPGLDGVTTDRFGEDIDRTLQDLAESVGDGTYSPGPLRRIAIPKSTGGHRTLAIPNVSDRVVQTAAAIWLDHKFEPGFCPSSYAYRPHLGARRAADALTRIVSPGDWAVVADIEKFFDNVEHDVLASDLKASGLDREDIEVVRRWLSAQTVGVGGRFVVVKGLPQGAPLSPVLSNLFLTPFDRALQSSGFTHIRYADDFVVVTRTQADAEQALALIRGALADRGLLLKSGKTDIVAVSSGVPFLSFEFDGLTRRVTQPKVDEFLLYVKAALEKATPGSINDLRRELQNVATGWRNYFGGASPEIERQLADLDVFVHRELCAHASRLGLGDQAIRLMTGAIGEVDRPVQPAGYPDGHASTKRDHPALVTPLASVYSKKYQLASQAIAADQAPLLSSRGHLYIPTHACYVARTGAVLTIKRKKAVVMEVPLDELSAVTIEAAGVSLSTEALNALAEARVPVTLCRPSGVPTARIVPARAWLTASVAEQQLQARSTQRGMQIAVEMIAAKISNQRALLLYWAKYQHRAVDLRQGLRSTASALSDFAHRCEGLAGEVLPNARGALFLTEAHAAAHYWSRVASLLPVTGFTRRRPKDHTDILNVALNYGYWILRNEVWSAIERTSMTPFIGFLHAGRRHSAALAYDLMEEFRQPVVDRAVIGMIGKGAKLHLDATGHLRLQSRRRLRTAINRSLERTSAGSRVPLRTMIASQAAAVQMAVLRNQPYRGYRMPW